MSRHIVDGNTMPEFTRMLVQLAEGFPTSGNLSEGTIRIYAWVLDAYDVDDIRDAFLRLLRVGSGFFPSTVELLRALGESVDGGLLAWVQLRNAAEDVGCYATVDVEDHAAACALLEVFGSWSAYCEHADGPALAERRKEFLASYQRHRLASVRHEGRWTRLPGLLESQGNFKPTPHTFALLALNGSITANAVGRLRSRDVKGLAR